MPEEFFDQRSVAFADIAVVIWRAERHHAVHPIRGIGPKHSGATDSLDEVVKLPVKRKPWNHSVEQLVRQWAFEPGGDAPRRPVEPDLAEALVDRGGKQQPHTLDATRVTANRSRVDIRSRGEHVHADEQVVRAHGREVPPYELRTFVGDPVSEEGTAFVRGGRVARIE